MSSAGFSTRLDAHQGRWVVFAPATPTFQMGFSLMIRTRTAGQVAAMIPDRLCCCPEGTPPAETAAARHHPPRPRAGRSHLRKASSRALTERKVPRPRGQGQWALGYHEPLNGAE